ncbi:hypothetical protein FCULG_00008025 [Fusarium culmorum]|uniref:J domain-containing protein n=1 Tax=Fusarium culmorum TaxID=5516 RepID=A0A2T4H219_FUSCU|nr:hypothetical protein FCULG_00008025 [Fusarium culmorum]
MTTEPTPKTFKRLIACCDGTWMDSDKGYQEPGLFEKEGSLQVPSNVTRISRCFEKRCNDGKLQVVNYESGVGTGSNMLDSITGGAFGQGLAERMRETYSFICSNYMDGDEIILVGFSRGAFTVRSVAGMIGHLGLLTREGVEFFYPIFKDMQHWMDDDYEDPFPNIPFPDKPKGKDAADKYRARLEQLGYTRVRREQGDEIITIRAVCVWDTVGSLGIPKIAWLDKLEHAFQALALDETRPPFSPAVWERLPENRYTTDLRQVWFPGNHGNIGGGWEDQGIANCTLAWMMDQLASIGVEFDLPSLERCFVQNVKYYHKTPSKLSIKSRKKKQKQKIPTGSRMTDSKSADLLQYAQEYASKNEDLYELLGVDALTPKEEIHRAWRKRSLKYHPDKAGDKFDAEVWEKFERARDILSDPGARGAYDGAIKAALLRKQEYEARDKKNKALVDDLEARENAWKVQREEKEQREKDEIEKERSRLVEQRRLREEEEKRQVAAAQEVEDLAEAKRRLKEKKEKKKQDEAREKFLRKSRMAAEATDGKPASGPVNGAMNVPGDYSVDFGTEQKLYWELVCDKLRAVQAVKNLQKNQATPEEYQQAEQGLLEAKTRIHQAEVRFAEQASAS